MGIHACKSWSPPDSDSKELERLRILLKVFPDILNGVEHMQICLAFEVSPGGPDLIFQVKHIEN